MSIGVGDCGVANSPGVLLLEMDNLIVGYLSPYSIPNCFDKERKEYPKSKGQRRKYVHCSQSLKGRLYPS